MLSCKGSFRTDQIPSQKQQMLSPYHGKIFYFCTFACIGRVLQKHFADKATGLLVVPKWPIEILLPLLIDTLISESFHHSF